MNKDVQAYNSSQSTQDKEVCDLLMKEIDNNMKNFESKIWHGHPVWFLNGNPIVGYSALKGGIRLLFWSGQSFDEPDLKNEGSFKASEVRYTQADQVNLADLHRWLEKATNIQWDYKNIVKRRGVLERLEITHV